MSRITVLPRDLKPGDKIDRMTRDMEIVPGTVSEVLKVRRGNRTAYKVYLAEYAALPDNRKPWAQNKHLVPFMLAPTAKVTVERTEA